MKLWPYITSYPVWIEDGGGNGGKSGFGLRISKYYQFWKFGDGRHRHLDLGATSANTYFYLNGQLCNVTDIATNTLTVSEN